MADAPKLEQFNNNLGVTQGNVLDARARVTSVKEKAETVRTALDTFAVIESTADTVGGVIDGLKNGVRLLEKVGPLKIVGKALKNVLDRMEDTVQRIENKAKEIDERLEPAKEQVDDAIEKLEQFEVDLDAAAAEVGSYRASGEGVEAGLGLIGDGAPQQAIADGVDAVVEPPNAVIVKVNEAYAFTKNAVDSLSNAINVGALNLAIEMRADLSKIAKDINFLVKPLDVLNSVLKPVQWALDAIDFVFNTVVAPVLNPILDALGVNALFDRIADSLNALLPNAVDLDFAEDAINDALDELLPDVGLDASLGVSDFISTTVPGEFGALDFVDLALGDPRLILGQDDVNDTLTGDGGDNVISGGGGDDALVGSGGADIFIGGAGDDTITGDQDGEDDRAVFSGSLLEYLVEFSDDERTVTVTHDEPANPLESDGVDRVTDVELFVFSDAELTRAALQLGVQTTASEGDTLLVGIDAADAEFRDFLFGIGEDDPVTLFGQLGDDHLVGGNAADFLDGGAGDDVLDGGAGGGDNLNGGTGIDTATFQSNPDVGQRIDLGAVAGDRAPFFSFTATLSSIENVIGSEAGDLIMGADNDFLNADGGEGTERLSGEGGDDVLRGFGGLNLMEGGDGQDIIMLEAATDVAVGGAGGDQFIVGGAAGKTVDGGAGFDTIDYSGAIDAIISTFDDDADGWTVIEGATLAFVATGGAPGGFIRGTDAPSGIWDFSAPAEYLGDQSDKFGGSLSFDLRLFQPPADIDTTIGEVSISDGATTLRTSIEYPTNAGFKTYNIALDETQQWILAAGGQASDADIAEVLSNLTLLTIQGEYTGGADQAGLDNVVLSSVPLAQAVTSDFESGVDGWSVTSFSNPLDLTVQAEFSADFIFGGGEPGDGIRETDPDNGTWYFKAAEKFGGDQSDKFGGTLSYALEQTAASGSAFVAPDVILQGQSFSLFVDTVDPNANFDTTSIELSSLGGWQILGGGVASDNDIRAVLSDLQAVYIRGEYISGADTATLDSVVLRGADVVPAANQFDEAIDILEDAPLAAVTTAVVVDIVAGTVEHRTGDADGALVGTDSVINVERYVGTARDDRFLAGLATATGAVIIDAGAGDDEIVEGLGGQSIAGGAGDDLLTVTTRDFPATDRFDGGEGTDTIDVSGVADTRWRISDAFDIVAGVSAEDDLPGSVSVGARMAGFERVISGDGDDDIFLEGLFVDAGAGDDAVTLLALDGGVYLGGDGDDQIDNVQGATATIDAGAGADVINTRGGFTDAQNVVHTITALGGAGDDRFNVSGGPAVFDGGADVDVLSFNGGGFIGAAQGSLILNLATGLAAGTAAEQTFLNFENVIATNFNDNVTGDNQSNLLVGLDGVDLLRGGGDVSTEELAATANDTLYGNDGDDILEGEAGDDFLHGGAGVDTLNGGAGNDTASYVFFQEHSFEDQQIVAGLMASVDVDLSQQSPRAIVTPTIVFEDFEGGAARFFGDQIENNATAGAGTAFTEFLGGFTGNGDSDPPSLQGAIELGDDHDGPVVIEFDFYEIDGWDNESFTIEIDGDPITRFYDNINNSVVESGSGSFDGGSFVVTGVETGGRDLGFGATQDNIHHYLINVTNPGAFLDIRIQSQAFTDGIAGIDNLEIRTGSEIETLIDIENAVGGALEDSFIGDNAANFFSGGGGDDVIRGGSGDDILLDDFGADQVFGEAGNDAIIVGGGEANGGTRPDFYNGGAGTDTLDYSGALGEVFIDPTDEVFRKTYTYDLAVWADTQTTEARMFGGQDVASLTPRMIQQALDPSTADSADDFFRDLSDVEQELDDLGVDEVADLITTISVEQTQSDTAVNFERYVGSQFDDHFVATADADDFDAGDIAPDEDDEDPEPPAADTIDFSRSNAGLTADIGAETFSGGFANGGSYVGFSNVVGTDFDDDITGDDDDNVIIAGTGQDFVDAGGGDDDVEGSGAGSTYILGAGADTLDHFTSEDGLVQAFGGDGDDSMQVLGDVALVRGGAGDDSITVLRSGGESLGAGEDQVFGDDGDDHILFDSARRIDGGEGSDTAQLGVAGSVTINLATGEILNPDGGEIGIEGAVLVSIENLSGRDSASNEDNFTGDEQANTLDGGLGGRNILNGGGGDDILLGGANDDDFIGGAGTDTAVVGRAGGANVDLNGVGADDTLQGFDLFDSIENLTGGADDDSFQGDEGANVLDGGSGGSDDLNGNGGDDTLITRGVGFMDGGEGDDVLRGHGFIFDGGAGVDTAVVELDDDLTIDLRITVGQATGATTGANLTAFIDVENLTTAAGDDHLIGTDDANELRGEGGDDVIEGRFGSDRMIGGDGDDTLVVIEDEADRTDFNELFGQGGVDTADFGDLHSAIAADLSTGAVVTRDGADLESGADRAVASLDRIENLVGGAFADSLTGDDGANVIRGGAGDDFIDGGDGDDKLHGEDGDDEIIGGPGADRIFGGDGDDVLTGKQSTDFLDGGDGDDIVIVDGLDTDAVGGDGFDTLVVLAGLSFAIDMSDKGFERVTGNSGDDVFDASNTNDFAVNLEGGDGDDELIGGFLDDTLDGGDGDDKLSGGAGRDLLRGRGSFFDGGEGDDTAEFTDAEGVQVDLKVATAQNTGVSTKTVKNIENLTGGAARDVFFGNALDNVLRGQGGNDDLFGDDGDDQLFGGDGDDALDGGKGDDLLDGGDGDDRIDFALATEGVLFTISGDGAIADGQGGTDTLVSIEGANGSAFDDAFEGDNGDNGFFGRGGADRILGRSGDDEIDGGDGDDELFGQSGQDFLFGGAGDDRLSGGGGADILDGGLGDDTFIVDNEGDEIRDNDGADTVITSVFFNLPGGIENLEMTSGAGDIDGQGNQENNTIIGSDGANFIKASGGDDMVIGGLGDDTLNGQSGDDELHGGDGLDFLTGKIGNDRLFGGADNDQLRGEEGDDHMEGGGAKDRLIGKANDDVLLGQEANDKLFGNSGEDVIVGGAGKDSMTGGEGFDVFILAPGDQVDTIRDFEVGIDQLDLSAYGFADFAEVEALMKEKNGRVQINLDGSDDVVRLNGVLQADLSAGDFILGGFQVQGALPDPVDIDLIGNAAANQIVGSPAPNQIKAGGDDDTVAGLGGGDRLFGNTGDDALAGGAGPDILDGGPGADAMDGGLGDDVFHVDDAGDTVADAGGVDTVIASVAFDLPGGIENLEFTSDAGDVDGQGNQEDNAITGSDGANVVKASGGDDMVTGGLGDDTLNGQSGDDELHGGDGLDFLTGKVGNDRLFGGADNDQLRGEAGDDHMEGGGAKDRLIGKANDDVLLGQEANDKLFGNSGDDVIVGGAGKDSMTGGAGFDVFVLAPGCQVDTIRDFEAGVDRLDVSAFGFADFAEVEALMKEKNGRVQINLDGSDDVVRLNGVLQADLSAPDFILN